MYTIPAEQPARRSNGSLHLVRRTLRSDENAGVCFGRTALNSCKHRQVPWMSPTHERESDYQHVKVDAPVTDWISQLADNDQQAAERLWAYFSARIRNLARQQLDPRTRRTYDENDAANSAFHSLCKGLQDGRFEHISDRDGMWGILAVITARKVAAQQRFEHRQKRGGGHVRGDSLFAELGVKGLDAVTGDDTTPEMAAIFTETCGRLVSSLGDPMLQQIVLLKFEGHRNTSVAEQIGRTRRTVERKLEEIRRIWVRAGIIDADTEE